MASPFKDPAENGKMDENGEKWRGRSRLRLLACLNTRFLGCGAGGAGRMAGTAENADPHAPDHCHGAWQSMADWQSRAGSWIARRRRGGIGAINASALPP